MKKIIAIVLVAAIMMSALTICGSAAYMPDQSTGGAIGQALGTIVFFPFILIDGIIWIITGVHIFYPQFD
ncbi:MAG: hypothetical protein IJD78_05450 [Clostridia bacterium]|nr:hypothetical protein [Clostridia bacterium]